MNEYVFTVPPRTETLLAGKIHQELKAVTEKVDAVTVATHTYPWVVFVRCRQPLSEEERQHVEERIRQI